ncbi:hypothetical protein ACFFTM_09815 [Pseudoduganella plicata]|uniref:CHAT domain-containing protein n=1 Tax=Pseudoduganella plicata TaxID=321984 RepID=A0A4P7BD11_9BURK|nr:hypothetical protein [Pseudoduganella plicata]QBQ35149.1 hypothetical protein E1742_02405 [Pseudoduganella plicata]GGZ05504.1 hypothetical protein GCM10007388_44030 [Pseudoduganella plicata]
MDTLFIPFSQGEQNAQLISMAARWQAAYRNQAWATQCENRVYSPGSPVLDGLNCADTLYILAHGQGTDLIINNPGLTGYVLDASALAMRLLDAHLPSRHRNIVLSICNTNGSLDAFATEFRDEMLRLHYLAVQVHYFGASVSIPTLLDAATGEVGQTVLFLRPGAHFISTPSGLAPTGVPLKAEHYKYQVQ